MPKTAKNDITGKRFDRLVAVSFTPTAGKHAKFLFKCDCGNEKEILAQAVISGATKSCGCYQKERMSVVARTHGQAGKNRTPTYNSWALMMDRCEWGGHPSYERYGARGIRVDKRWHKFERFYDDMGDRPKGKSIDRIDNNRGYSLENCRWATQSEQARNTSTTIFVKHEGLKVSFMDLCERMGLSSKAIRSRAMRRGKDYVLALKSAGVSDVDYYSEK